MAAWSRPPTATVSDTCRLPAQTGDPEGGQAAAQKGSRGAASAAALVRDPPQEAFMSVEAERGSNLMSSK